MRLIKPKFEIIEQDNGLDGICKQIECAGRTCYHSQNKITEGSAKKFTETMIKSGHGAMLEHGTIYLKIPFLDLDDYVNTKEQCCCLNYDRNKFSFIYYEEPFAYVSTNLRVLVENGWMNDLQYLCEPTEYHKKRVTVRFTCDRAIANEFVRHRVFSFAQESSRYCNYSKDKFGNELTFIEPNWVVNAHFIKSLQLAEEYYLFLLNDKHWKPEQARNVLPNALKTELVMTGFISDWEHFFDLRCDNAAHPQARELAIPLKEEFIKRGYIKK